MDGELRNLALVWISVFTSLCYCHTIAKFIPSGTTRLAAILPVIGLFLLVPLPLTTISFCGFTAFFVAWLANFKLLLFAFGKGPLFSNPPLSLLHFIPISCLPIKVHSENTKKGLKSPINYAIKLLVIASFLPLYERKERINKFILMLVYTIHVYISLEICLALVGAVARTVIGVEVEPQFDEPYLATSLQDFWGRRWNLMVTNIMRPSVYDPVRSISIRVIGKRWWAPLPAVFATFLVSGLVHELVFCYIGRKGPAWVVTRFFILHGAAVACEIGAKRMARKKGWRFPVAASRMLTVGFVVPTALWLFLPPLLECGAEAKTRSDIVALIDFFGNMWNILRFSSFTIVNGMVSLIS